MSELLHQQLEHKILKQECFEHGVNRPPER